MSRIGKKIIEIPSNVDIVIDGNFVTIKGPKGELTRRFRSVVQIVKKDNILSVKTTRNDQFAKSLWGLSRTLLSNMVIGVTDGFERKLEFHGVGYRVNVEKAGEKDKLVLNVGYSHSVEIIAPENVNFKVDKNKIIISGIDKEQIGHLAAKIRNVRPPEPYKGKGIKYIEETIRRKEGKAVAKVEGAGGE
jgi:large subunit ribosomal protein L6